jgi:hypothetical protein
MKEANKDPVAVEHSI